MKRITHKMPFYCNEDGCKNIAVIELKSGWHEQFYICAPCLRKALKLIEEDSDGKR